MTEMRWGGVFLSLLFVLQLSVCEGLLLEFNSTEGDVVAPASSVPCTYQLFEPDVPVFGVTVDTFRLCNDGKVKVGSRARAGVLWPYSMAYLPIANSLWYGAVNDGPRLHTISNIVEARREPGFKGSWMLVVTWDEVPSVTCLNPLNNACKRNTFQLILVTDKNVTYALYSYGSLNVRKPDAPRIGFGPSWRKAYQQIPPDPFRRQVKRIGRPGRFESNAHVPGVWLYKVSGSNILDVCSVASPCGPAPNECTNPSDTNTDHSWRCTCGDGFTLDQSTFAYAHCQDINECLSSPCQPLISSCINTYGSYECECISGYINSPQTQLCVDIDECVSQPCRGNHGICNNTEGSFTCLCEQGFTRTMGVCVDVDECVESRPCSNFTNTVCNNTYGGYTCLCEEGYQPIANSPHCQDVDECATDICPDDVKYSCLNTEGSYLCPCRTGYRFDDGLQSCVADFTCRNDTVGYVLDSTGMKFFVANLAMFSNDIIRLSVMSDACGPVEVNFTEQIGKTQGPVVSHYQILPFEAHPPDYIKIDASPSVPGDTSSMHVASVETDKDVTVHAYFTSAAAPTVFLLYPADVLAVTYILNVPFTQLSQQHSTSVVIAALNKRVLVTIKLPFNVPKSSLKTKRAIGDGGTESLTLEPFQTHRFSVQGADLSGTEVTASTEIAVFTAVHDILTSHTRVHQAPPLPTLGRLYMHTEFHDKIKVVSTQHNTEVWYDGVSHYMKDAGDVMEIKNHIGVVEADKPISVTAISGQMVEILHPLESVIVDQYTFTTLPSAGSVFFTLVIVTHSAFHKDLRLDGLELDDLNLSVEWVIPSPGSTYCYAKVYGLRNGVYTLTHPTPSVGFLATVYAHHLATMEIIYSYPIGASLRDITCVPSDMHIGDMKDNDCDGRVDEEICGDGEDFDEDGQMSEDCESSVTPKPKPPTKPSPALMSKTCCHGSVCKLNCPQDHILRVIQSHYGRYNYIGETTCGFRVDEMMSCGLTDANDILMGECENKRSCFLEVTRYLFEFVSNCTLGSLYLTVDYLCLAAEEVECALPAVRNVLSLDGREQFVASNPPSHPAYAHYEVLTHHANIDNGLHTDYTYLHSLGEPALACHPSYADMSHGLVEWCTDETDPIGAYIQVFIGGPYRVVAVLLQGARTEEYWVTQFSLQYSDDDRGLVWQTVVDNSGQTKIFPGCSDARQTVLVHLEGYSFNAKYIRLVVEGYHRYAALHLDFLRCLAVSGCEHLTITHSSVVNKSLSALESVVGECDVGYTTPYGTRYFHLICDKNGRWDGVTTCQEITCGPFRTANSLKGLPVQGSVFLDGSRFLGESGSDNCPADSDKLGLTYIKCHEHDMWRQIPVCEIRDKSRCDFPAVENAMANIATANVGAVAQYQCLAGYEFNSQSTSLTCATGGVVTGVVPQCRPIILP